MLPPATAADAAEERITLVLSPNVLKSIGSPTAHTATVLIKRSRLKHILTVTTATKLMGLYPITIQ